MLNLRNFLLLTFFLTITSGCSISNQNASLLTASLPNVSSSIKDLDANLINTESKKITDDQSQSEYIFTYQKNNPDKISKITLHKNTSGSKIIHHFYLTDQKVTHVSTEDHKPQGPSTTKLVNHSFKVNEDKVTDCIYQNSKHLDLDDENVAPLVTEIESEINYIYSNLIESEPSIQEPDLEVSAYL